MKLPKELEMPQMKDHQMFDRERIVQLQDELQDKFKELKVGPVVRVYLCDYYIDRPDNFFSCTVTCWTW